MSYLVNTLSPQFVLPSNIAIGALQGAMSNVGMQVNPWGGMMNPWGGMMNPMMMQRQGTEVESSSKPSTPAGLETLTGDDLVSARVDADEFPVTDAHVERAGKFVSAAKDILVQNGRTISKDKWEILDTIFDKVKSNPMLAEAFIAKANDTTFEKSSDNTETLLGCYQSALVEKYNGFGDGKTSETADRQVQKLKDDLEIAVGDRNEKVWNEFNSEYKADRAHTTDGFGSTFNRNRENIIAGGIGAAGIGTACLLGGPIGWTIGLGALGVGAFKFFNK